MFKKTLLILFLPIASFGQDLFKESSINIANLLPKGYRVVDFDIGILNNDDREGLAIIIKNDLSKQKAVGVFFRPDEGLWKLSIQNSKFFFKTIKDLTMMPIFMMKSLK